MFAKPRSAPVGKPSLVVSSSGSAKEGAVREVVAVDEEELGVARGRVVEVELGARQRLRRHRPRLLQAPPRRDDRGRSVSW